MSALSGVGSKGEKQKSKFQSLDINKIYRVSRGETTEKTQQKNTVPYKHGMQILGKVPNARRPPANLPSLKSEHSGSEAAVPLVPPGGPGWGKQDSNSISNNSPSGHAEIHQNTTPPSHQGSSPPQLIPQKQEVPHVSNVPIDKSWSSVMSRSDPHSHPPVYQGPQFQHDFPSLSAAENVQARGGSGSDIPYSSGLSLRPQTEGSWILGGSGSGGEAKLASAHLGAPPQLSAQAGLAQQQQTLPPQYRGVMPSFMYKNNPPANNTPNSMGSQHNIISSNETTARLEKPHYQKKSYDDIVQPSIIKEEELHRMDEIERDMGWAYSDDIDYNKKLSFSDDEQCEKKSKPKQKPDTYQHDKMSEVPKREINDAWPSTKGPSAEEDDIKVKRNQHSKEIEMAVQRAKQRKKEEEKRFNDTKQGAQQKLRELEEKISKRDRDYEEGVGTINPSSVPPKPIAPTEIPLPDFKKDKDSGSFKQKEERVRNLNEQEDKSEKPVNTFKQLTEIEGKTSFRRNAKNSERDSREPTVPNFSRQFQNNLPPRFQRQHNQQGTISQFHDHYDSRSSATNNFPKGNNSNMRKLPSNNSIHDHDFKSINEEFSMNPYINQESLSKSEVSYSNNDSHDYESLKIKKSENIFDDRMEKKDPERDLDRKEIIQHKINDTFVTDIKPKITRVEDSYERFQRLDSHESKMSRGSKYSDLDNREYSWSESKYELSYDERRRETPKEDRRQVPGPITRDRIEAEDLNESRNLTALKRGQLPEKKISNEIKNEENKSNENNETKNVESSESKIWGDNSEKSKCTLRNDEKDGKSGDNAKKNMKHEDLRDDKRGSSSRNKIYPQNKAWNSDFNRSNDRGGWSKRSNTINKNVRPNISNKTDSSTGIITDSEGSSEEHNQNKTDNSQTNTRTDKVARSHSTKDDKRQYKVDNKDRSNEKAQDGTKRDNYIPRGEPSRHGRGGGNFRSRGGLSKRIDGYGPPTSKSPFAHHEKRSNESDLDIRTNFSNSSNDKTAETRMDEKNFFPEDRHSDEREYKYKTNKNVVKQPGVNSSSTSVKKFNQSRSSVEKKTFGTSKNDNSNSKGKPEESDICSAIADISLKKEEQDEEMEDVAVQGDSDGFQEVKSKKTVKERPKVEEKPAAVLPGKNIKTEKDREKVKKPTPQSIQHPTHNIPPLMATLVNPPHILPQTNKNQFDRQNRQNKIPPRFAKLRENNRLQKMQQQQGSVDLNDVKNNQCRNLFSGKSSGPPNGNPVAPLSNAWDKPLSTHLRPMETENMLTPNLDSGNNNDQTPCQGDPDVDKKANKVVESAILDGTTPPVNTIIFENTNFKTAPTNKNNRNDKMRKEDGGNMDNQTINNFNKPINDLLNKSDKQTDSIQLQLPFKEDSGDMKLDFFDSDLTLADEKALKNTCLTRSMHSVGTGGNTISTADALNFKIQSVKKVWETPAENSVQQEDSNSFTSSFVPDPSTLDSSSFVKNTDNVEDNHEHGYSPAVNQQTTNNTTNVCKVKPTQQVSGTNSQPVSSTSGNHPGHSGMMAPGLMGNPLSPPPIQPVIGAGVGIGQPPQQYPTNQHIGYQTGLGSSSQYGMSTIPSPPSVLPYTAQPLQAQTANLYGPFQIDQTGVLGGQGRSQFSQYPNHYGLGQAASSPYSAQSMFLPTAQAHPPPAAQGPEIYQNLNSYRLSTAAPFGQNQQLNNPTTVLISSTSNSLMSASVKPSTQQISAIGTKSGGVGQAYQQQSQQGQQMFMYDPNIPANYLQGAGVLQRPTGPVQNNVVPTIQPSSSYYSASTATAKSYNCSWRF